VERNLIAAEEERPAPLPTLIGPATPNLALASEGDETFVTDDRAGLSPAQHVERRLVALLKSSPIFVSHVQRLAKPTPR
jgi:hypothetical protein